MNGKDKHLTLADEQATRRLGEALAAAIEDGLQVHLEGEMGTGKTCLVRALIQALGHAGPVRSPTYTLVEPYHAGARDIWHLDLYRLTDPEELAFLGVRDLSDPRAIVLVEWPRRGTGMLPPADLEIELLYRTDGREARLRSKSPRGEPVLRQLATHF